MWKNETTEVRVYFRCLTTGIGLVLLLASQTAVQAESGQSPWVAIEDDRGITLVPVLACRTRKALSLIASSKAENRRVLARLSVKQGECTRLPRYTSIVPISRTSESLHFRTLGLGRLWVLKSSRVPGLAEMTLAGRLKAESSVPAPTTGLSADEQDAVDAQLAEKDTVPGAVGRLIGGGQSDIRGGGSNFDKVQLVSWRQIFDGYGYHRCTEFRVRYDGGGSRLVSPSSFTARFKNGRKRRGQRLRRGIRLSRGQAATGVVCFGEFSGASDITIVALNFR